MPAKSHKRRPPDATLKAIGDRFVLPQLTPPAPPRPVTKEQAAELNVARDQSMGLIGLAPLDAARRVDAVLNQSLASANAHSAASRIIAMPAFQALH